MNKCENDGDIKKIGLFFPLIFKAENKQFTKSVCDYITCQLRVAFSFIV